MSTQRSEDPFEKAEAFMFELMVGQITSLCCMERMEMPKPQLLFFCDIAATVSVVYPRCMAKA